MRVDEGIGPQYDDSAGLYAFFSRLADNSITEVSWSQALMSDRCPDER